MKILIFVSMLFALKVVSLDAQKYTISGYVEDVQSGERLLGASVLSSDNDNLGCTTNDYGFFSLTVPHGVIKLSIRYVGYESINRTIDLKTDTLIIVKLSPSLHIDEVVINGKTDPVTDNQMGLIEIPLKTIKKLPVFFGETDIMKSVQMMPGIKSGAEGTSGIYVRGGSPDQNLILIDGVPVYNMNHLFGLFSVFNSDAISRFDVIKGGFPARYGGHLSSVIDVRMKEGNMQAYKTSYNIGILSSSILTEGPIIKDKCSFMITGRRSYIDLLVVPVEWGMNKLGLFYGSSVFGYYFNDLNAKVNYKFSDKDRLYLSFFHGKDKFYVKSGEIKNGDKNKLGWGNRAAALRWNHIFSPKLFANTALTQSVFNYKIEQTEHSLSYFDGTYNDSEDEFSFYTSINDISGKIDFHYMQSPNYTMRFGASGIYHRFNPGFSASRSSYNSIAHIDTSYGDKQIEATEYSAYVENEFKIGKRLSLNIGGRITSFSIKDTTFFSSEPRLSARVLITESFSLKAGYSKMKQYVNLLTSTSVGFPTDIWIPSTDRVLPQTSTQYSLSANFKLLNTYDLVVEGYYKEMNNLVEYKEGASLFLNFDNITVKDANAWENKVTQGNGWSYGMEFLLRKDVGKLNGWLGYTLSWANRQFDEIDDGKVFPYTYDRRHDISISCAYQLNEKVDLGLNWVFSTGNMVTLATSNYLSYVDVESYANSIKYSDGESQSYHQSTDHYAHRNNFRMPAYHRLDLGADFKKEKKRGSRTLSLGLYNAYCHLNPFMVEVYEEYEGERFIKKSAYASAIFPIIPSVSYKFTFN